LTQADLGILLNESIKRTMTASRGWEKSSADIPGEKN
jgi:hypothetical protein